MVDGAVCIVSGTVIDYTYAKIEAEEKTSYKTILQFQISKVLKGNVAKKSIDILLPVNMKENIKIEDNDYIEMLERGVEAVLVIQSNEDTTKHFTLNGRQIAYRKLADYYYSGNRRDIIVRKNNCLYYDKLVYQNLSHKNTLAEVEDYIKDLAAESN